MLELRPSCENCDKPLPNHSNEAMICSYECTFCKNCVENILKNVCPNCGGGFEKRPSRPKAQLQKYPPSTKRVSKPVDMDSFANLLMSNQAIPPRER